MLRASLHPKKIGLLYLALTLESWGKGPKGLEMEMCIPSMAPCIEGNLHWILSFAMTFCSLFLFSQRNQKGYQHGLQGADFVNRKQKQRSKFMAIEGSKCSLNYFFCLDYKPLQHIGLNWEVGRIQCALRRGDYPQQ